MKFFIKRIILFASIFILLIFGYAQLSCHAAENSDSFWIEYIDVGQGDCALIQCDGHYMLIDGGPVTASRKVYSVLRQKGVSKLDVIIATHPDADHIGGLSAALVACQVGKCYFPVTEYDTKTFNNLVRYLGNQGVNITVPTAGDEFKIGSAIVDILGPLTITGDDSNNDSIVAKITYGNNKFLFMGDAEKEEEYSLIKAKTDLTCDVLKVGHHGSSYSTSGLLLSKAKPAYAIISVGADNDYGHPTEKILKRLKSRKIEIYRTDLQGDITCISDGENIAFSTAKTEADSEIDIPDGTTYILNTGSMKFHRPDCESVQDMSFQNMMFSTDTAENIKKQGYTPCKICNPGQE